MTDADIINRYSTLVLDHPHEPDPKLEARAEKIMGDILDRMATLTTYYAAAYRVRFGDEVGEDYVLGPAVESILLGLLGLLNGPTGAVDCGTLDRLLRETGAAAKIEGEDFQVVVSAGAPS